jgi:RNA 3'-terminal phosphate cyclase (ATP)
LITIDGSRGEGGGQVLRTCLSLSAITGQSFQINRIRANRSKPGLRPQHLTAVRAVAAFCNAAVEGGELDSAKLLFEPKSAPVGGSYKFDVTKSSSSGRSAGSVTLILQAILWPLLFADRSAEITLLGGTFVPFSPPYHYFSEVALPAFARFGIDAETSLIAWGWMSEGRGEVTAVIRPIDRLECVDFQPITNAKVEGVAAVTNLPSHIPHRMARRAYNMLDAAGYEADVQPIRAKGAGPGAGIVLWMPQAGFSSLGRIGLPADKVAEAAIKQLRSFTNSDEAVDHHLADQLLLPMALAHGRSSFSTNRLTSHTLTNVSLLRQWLNVRIDVQGKRDGPGKVVVYGAGHVRD